MESEVRPVMLGGEHVTKAMKDDSFYEKLPQFLPIKAKIAAMHVNLKHPGCTPCQQRRIRANVERDFVAIASALDTASAKVFKDYFGVPRMVTHAVDPKTHKVYLKEL